MRICHVVGDSRFGGGSMIVLSLLEAARRAGHEVAVVGTDPRFRELVTEAGGEAVGLDCVRRRVDPLWDLVGAVRLGRHLRSARYDLVHTHTTKGGMIGRVAARLAGVPAVVHTVHGFAFHEQSRPAVVGLIANLEKIAGAFCDRIVTVSRFHRKWALELGIAPAAKIVAIPNGIEPPVVAPDADRTALRASLGAGPGTTLIVAMGRLATQKGFVHLLDAAARLRDRGLDFRVVIAGTGPLDEALQAHADGLGLGESVRFLGFRSDVGDLFAAADIVAQPSLWEGLSISLLEAMSLGCCVVTTDINSNLEVLDGSDAGVIVPAGNAGALADALADLAPDAERRAAIGAAARSLFASGYTVGRMQEAYVRLYEELDHRRTP